MYASGMAAVRRFPVLTVAIALVAACAADRSPLPDLDLRYEPPAPRAPREPEGGFLGSPADRRFHRTDCPRTAEIDPARREFWASPYEALDAGYSPCPECEPMLGWR
jgi:hypothetical protein